MTARITLSDIQRAIAGDEVGIVLQPVVALTTGSVVGYEALSRFTSGPTPDPAPWFAAAQRYGVAPALESHAVRRAVAGRAALETRYLAINASPAALASEEMFDALPDDLHGIVVEITEQDDRLEDTLLRSMHRLRERGARIAVDDTGAGYAGLRRLMELRPDMIKLDRAFVTGIDGDPAKSAMVEALVRYGAATGAWVCAEGIETDAELVAVADLDVAFGQGWALGAAAPDPRPPSAHGAALCRSSLALAMHPVHADMRAQVHDLERLTSWLSEVDTLDDLAGVVHQVADLLVAPHVLLSVVDDTGAFVQELSDTGWTLTGDRFPISEYPATAAALQTGEVVQVVAQIAEIDEAELEVVRRFGHAGVLIVPIRCRGQAVGLLEVYTDRSYPFSRAQVRRARIAAGHIGLVIRSLTPHSRADLTAG
jgi:EAL domain-containing protein (putative c-di-GMP-specific phosphodiesterase class I)